MFELGFLMVSLDYAFGENDKVLKYVDSFPVGLDCGCICPICGEALIAYNQGKKQAHHFKHVSGAEHEINPMTRIHMLSEIIISKEFRFRLEYDAYTRIRNIDSKLMDAGLEVIDNGLLGKSNKVMVNRAYADGQIEYNKNTDLGPLRYDVYFKDTNLAVEIFVTHRVDEEKKQKIANAGDWCVEMDLSDISRDVTYQELERIVKNFHFDNFDVATSIFGTGVYYDYVRHTTKKYDGFLNDVLYLGFPEYVRDVRSQRQFLYDFVWKYSDDYDDSVYKLIRGLNSNGVRKFYEKLMDVDFEMPYSKLEDLNVEVDINEVPGKYGVYNVVVGVSDADDWNRSTISETIFIGWVYL